MRTLRGAGSVLSVVVVLDMVVGGRRRVAAPHGVQGGTQRCKRPRTWLLLALRRLSLASTSSPKAPGMLSPWAASAMCMIWAMTSSRVSSSMFSMAASHPCTPAMPCSALLNACIIPAPCSPPACAGPRDAGVSARTGAKYSSSYRVTSSPSASASDTPARGGTGSNASICSELPVILGGRYAINC